MALNVNDMLKKADRKGVSKDSVVQKPWQEESVLYPENTLPSSIDNQYQTFSVYEIDPSEIENWVYHDRPESELGDISELAENLVRVGQQQPCIVRRTNSSDKKYELIIGERRWHAAQKAGIKLKVVIVNYTDNEAAIAQATENDNRKDLSDYAKGVSYSRLIDNNIISKKDLMIKLGKSKQYISSLLSFKRIPEEICNAIGDMSLVSAKTAERIKQLSSKGDKYKDIIISLADKIRTGKMGHSLLERRVQEALNKKLDLKKEGIKIISSSGRHLGSLRLDSNGLPSIHTPKDVANIVFFDEDGRLNKDSIQRFSHKWEKIIQEEIELQKKSPRGDF